MLETPETLARLLSPLTPAAFFEDYWGQCHLHVSRAAPDFYDAVLRVGELDGILQSEQLPAAFIRLVREGRDHGVEEWSHIVTTATGAERVAIPKRLFGLCYGGATLIFNQANRALTSLNLVCRELALELGFSAQANIYVSPPESHGFVPHSDDHEILILQIAGNKIWHLYPAAGPEIEIEVQAGDLLYLPRGLAHDVRSASTACIHVSLGMKPTYAFQLVEELAATIQEDLWFRRPAPLRFAGENALREFETEFRERVRGLIGETPVSALLEQRARVFRDKQSASWPGRLTDLLRITEMTLDTVVCARTGIMITLDTDEQFLRLRFGGGELTVPKLLRPSLDRITQGTPFAIRDLPGLIPITEKVALIRRFVESGFVSVLKN